MKNDLSPKKEQIVFGDDAIVIQKYISGIKGGRTLDVSDYPAKVIKVGSVVITKDGVYKPMPLKAKMNGENEEKDENGNTVYEYATLPAGFSYAGVVRGSTLTKDPAVSVMFNGEVNSEALPYPMDTILATFKEACPLICFIKDEEA